MLSIIKKACTHYPTLGSNTRLIIRITVIAVVSLLIGAVYCENAVNNPYYYELISFTDELIICARSFTGTGFLAIIFTGISENYSKQQL